MDATERYDVVIATDCRLPGGTSASVAEEIRAQARAGYRTGMVQVDSDLVARARPFNERITRCLRDDLAELVVGTDEVDARLLVLRHPAIFAGPDPLPCRVTSHRRVMVVNQAPTGRGGDERFYDPAQVHASIDASLGGEWTWAPIGPAVREALAPWSGELDLLDQDWVNVIDGEDWAVDRGEPVGAIPVIGRHGRDSWQKWPESADEILAAYPDADDVRVEILGGAEAAERVIGYRPPNWRVHPFGSMSVRRFLAGIDLFVYYHHPGSVEAFGRTILEALASGAPAVLPPHFERLFGEAAVYGPPSSVRATVAELHRDREAYRQCSELGRRVVAERFGHDVHARRVESLIGPPATASGPGEQAPAVDPHAGSPTVGHDADPDAPKRILFVTSNGAGVGHLMRLMAMARRLTDDYSPLFVTMSQAVRVVRELGFPVEYIPSRAYAGSGYAWWHDLLARRMGEIIATHDPVALVFDGTHPYRGLLRLREEHPQVTFVWSRRAMWKPGIDNPIEFFSEHFDLIIEPGEFAEEVDAGATVARREEATRVAPVLLLDEDDLLPRREARAALGLDPQRPAALVQLGAGNINDLDSVLGMVVQRLGKVEGLRIAMAESAIAAEPTHELDVHRFSVYPLARYLRAFDFAVAASGYNTFHELVAFGVPTIFVPNLETQADDQGRRADHAEQVGVGLSLRDPTPASFDRCLSVMLDPDRRAQMRARARALHPGNGAGTAMRAIETAAAEHAARTETELLGDRAGRIRRRRRPLRRLLTRLRAGWRRLDNKLRREIVALLRRVDTTFQQLPPGPKRVLRPVARPIARRIRPKDPRPTVLFVIRDEEPAAIARLVAEVGVLARTTSGFHAVFLTFSDDFTSYRRHGALFEYVMPPEAWAEVPGAGDWDDHLERRIATLVDSHGVDHVITLEGDLAEGGLDRAVLGGLVRSATPGRTR